MEKKRLIDFVNKIKEHPEIRIPYNADIVVDWYLKSINQHTGEVRTVSKNDVLQEFERFKCNYCGRTFIKKTGHKCKGNIRKRHLSFSIITLGENG